MAQPLKGMPLQRKRKGRWQLYNNCRSNSSSSSSRIIVVVVIVILLVVVIVIVVVVVVVVVAAALSGVKCENIPMSILRL